jgi:hypothetical protein
MHHSTTNVVTFEEDHVFNTKPQGFLSSTYEFEPKISWVNAFWLSSKPVSTVLPNVLDVKIHLRYGSSLANGS